MKAHGMFARVLKRSALPLVEGGCALAATASEEHRGRGGYCVSAVDPHGACARVTANGLYR